MTSKNHNYYNINVSPLFGGGDGVGKWTGSVEVYI